jgi:hypothetical protein
MKKNDVFWESIRNASGWSWALGEARRHPQRWDERGPNWSETALHWALMGSVEACVEILPSRPDLLGVLDSQGRSALDWAVEKIYFLREAQETETQEARRKSDALIHLTMACALHAISWIQTSSEDGASLEWSGDADRAFRCALTAGELDLACKLARVAPTAPAASSWLAGLAGLWRSKDQVKDYLAALEERCSIKPQDMVLGRPLGLHVAWLWSRKQVAERRAAWFHELGARLDEETSEESIEVFCSDAPDGGGRLERLQKRLDI